MKKLRKWYRMWKVLSLAFTVLIQVYWYRILRKPELEWEKLWENIGCRFRQTLFELEGLLIKVGQLLSIRADLLPKGFIKQIQDLVDQVPPSSWEEMKNVMEKEWGGPIENTLQLIDPKAVASASIGEVFRGKLKDGTDVAIKVMRPTIRSIVKVDFRSLSIIIWFAHYLAPVPKGFIDFRLLYKELKHVIGRELDFMIEKDSAKRFRERFKSFEKLKIPYIYEELSTPEVLVMEWVDGVRITNVEFIKEHHIDQSELAENLFRIFLPQWLEAGIFHADPHAGNVLLQEDGTIVLLDFGMIGEITKKDAKHFQELLEAVLMKNDKKAADVLAELEFILPQANPGIIEKVLEEALSLDLSQLKQLDMIALKKEMNDMVKALPVQVPTRFVFLGRSFVTIEGMIHTICPEKETLEVIKPAFLHWMKSSDTNKWKLLINWLYSQPIFHAVPKLLNSFQPSKEHQQRREFEFAIFENQKKFTIYFGLLGMAGSYSSMHVQNEGLLYISAGVAGLSAFAYFYTSMKEKRWLKMNYMGQK